MGSVIESRWALLLWFSVPPPEDEHRSSKVLLASLSPSSTVYVVW